jgi:hypothetical protein
MVFKGLLRIIFFGNLYIVLLFPIIMAESQLVSLVETMDLHGDPIPSNMVEKLFEDRGNYLDQKCCHCGILYEHVSKVQSERGASSSRETQYRKSS